jgi:hypothetical protein
MKKATWKMRSMAADVARAMSTAPNISAAARQVGVNRSTLHRLIKAGKIPPLTRQRRPAVPSRPHTPPNSDPSDTWRQKVDKTHVLNATEMELAAMAERARRMAHNDALAPVTQLQAMARYQALIKQLNLEDEPDHGQAPTTGTPTTPRACPRRLA